MIVLLDYCHSSLLSVSLAVSASLSLCTVFLMLVGVLVQASDCLYSSYFSIIGQNCFWLFFKQQSRAKAGLPNSVVKNGYY